MNENYGWYPGHMAKAIRMMQKELSSVDMLIEIADARAPRSSRNPDIDALCAQKPRLTVLNKADLADPGKSSAWVKALEKKDAKVILINSKDNTARSAAENAVSFLMADKIKKDKAKGIKTEIRAMIAGIPNVGKSTFINTMAGKAVAKTENRPGVTRGKQWISLGTYLRVLDTPGVLWPKFEDEETGRNLAILGSLNDENHDMETLACALLNIMSRDYEGLAASFYGYGSAEADEVFREKGYLIREAAELDLIAAKRGCIIKGGRFDTERAARILLKDFRDGRLGRVTLENAV